MHGDHQRSMGRRVLWQVYHFLLVALVAWLLFGGGLGTTSSWLGTSWSPGDFTRRTLVFLTSLTLFLRWGLTNFHLLKREMPWVEIFVVCVELSVIHTACAVLGGRNAEPVGAFALVGIGLFAIGSYLNTGSELMRARWKKDPDHDRRIYDQGLFRHSMHINYFGDLVWSTGLALISGSVWIALVPVYMSFGFIFLHIPRLDRHLKERYGDQFDRYAGKTRKLVPFIY
jgi:protein-S-isoprenylcysteine O-methyltransferase Ste14